MNYFERVRGVLSVFTNNSEIVRAEQGYFFQHTGCNPGNRNYSASHGRRQRNAAQTYRTIRKQRTNLVRINSADTVVTRIVEPEIEPQDYAIRFHYAQHFL